MPDTNETALDDWSPDNEPKGPRIPDIELEKIIGQGGMGVVYRGRQPYLDRSVAVKLLLPRPGMDAERFANRFRREAKILASLSHPHIVSCYQAGVTDDGQCYLAMEYIEGTSLQAWLNNHGRLRYSDALTVTATIAEALRYALAKGIIHRDVKPDNILLQQDKSKPEGHPFPYTAKLVDLGLARPYEDSEDHTRLTMEGAVMGTPMTMAPEQINDPDNVDWRADIYGLGCVLYHMVTGERAFPQKTLAAIAAAKTQAPPPIPRKVSADVPSAISDLVVQLLSVQREKRPDYDTLIERCSQINRSRLEAQRSNFIQQQGAGMLLIAALLLGGLGTLAYYLSIRGSMHQQATRTGTAIAKTQAIIQPAASPTPVLPKTPRTTLPSAEFATTGTALITTLQQGLSQHWNVMEKASDWGLDDESNGPLSLVATPAGDEGSTARLSLKNPLPDAWKFSVEVTDVDREIGIDLNCQTSRTLLLYQTIGTTHFVSLGSCSIIADKNARPAPNVTKSLSADAKKPISVTVEAVDGVLQATVGTTKLPAVDLGSPPRTLALFVRGKKARFIHPMLTEGTLQSASASGTKP